MCIAVFLIPTSVGISSKCSWQINSTFINNMFLRIFMQRSCIFRCYRLLSKVDKEVSVIIFQFSFGHLFIDGRLSCQDVLRSLGLPSVTLVFCFILRLPFFNAWIHCAALLFGNFPGLRVGPPSSLTKPLGLNSIPLKILFFLVNHSFKINQGRTIHRNFLCFRWQKSRFCEKSKRHFGKLLFFFFFSFFFGMSAEFLDINCFILSFLLFAERYFLLQRG
mmetsp:Transcript_36298/g.46579  ORF Transcript_36298/g.46579 Transcript_36298/m.46579 type:complete len:220 (+) Transcript_36298:596-1255(+)